MRASDAEYERAELVQKAFPRGLVTPRGGVDQKGYAPGRVCLAALTPCSFRAHRPRCSTIGAPAHGDPNRTPGAEAIPRTKGVDGRMRALRRICTCARGSLRSILRTACSPPNSISNG